jgi:hypothetical protein
MIGHRRSTPAGTAAFSGAAVSLICWIGVRWIGIVSTGMPGHAISNLLISPTTKT